MGNPIKRQRVLTHLSKLEADIALLQETRLEEIEAMKLRRGWVGQVYFSPAVHKKNGVVILVHKRLNATLVSQEIDTDGRWIFIKLLIDQIPISILNVYGPTKVDNQFFGTNLLKFF